MKICSCTVLVNLLSLRLLYDIDLFMYEHMEMVSQY